MVISAKATILDEPYWCTRIQDFQFKKKQLYSSQDVYTTNLHLSFNLKQAHAVIVSVEQARAIMLPACDLRLEDKLICLKHEGNVRKPHLQFQK